MKRTWNLIGLSFFASQSNFMRHRESAFDVILRKVYLSRQLLSLQIRRSVAAIVLLCISIV